MSNESVPIQIAERLDFESKLFAEGDPTKDHKDVEARHEAHLAKLKSDAKAENDHAKEVAEEHKKKLAGEPESTVDLANVTE